MFNLHLFCVISMFVIGRCLYKRFKCLKNFNELSMYLVDERGRGVGKNGRYTQQNVGAVDALGRYYVTRYFTLFIVNVIMLLFSCIHIQFAIHNARM